MQNLKAEIQSKLTNRKETGWRELCANPNVREEFVTLVVDSIQNGKNPKKVRSVLDLVLFDGINILDVDVLMRLK